MVKVALATRNVTDWKVYFRWVCTAIVGCAIYTSLYARPLTSHVSKLRLRSMIWFQLRMIVWSRSILCEITQERSVPWITCVWNFSGHSPRKINREGGWASTDKIHDLYHFFTGQRYVIFQQSSNHRGVWDEFSQVPFLSASLEIGEII